MITIKDFTGPPMKSYLGGVDLYRLHIDNPNRQEVHTNIRDVLGHALYRMEDFNGLGYTQVYVHRRLVEGGLLNFDEFLMNEASKMVIEDDDEDRTKISIPDVGFIVLVETMPKYEFADQITEKEMKRLNLDEYDRIGMLEQVEVVIDQRGHGYARELMEAALKLAEKKQLSPIYLNASPMGFHGLDLQELTAFYMKFGFTVFKRQGKNNLMIRE